jgi:hypothetical protein
MSRTLVFCARISAALAAVSACDAGDGPPTDGGSADAGKADDPGGEALDLGEGISIVDPQQSVEGRDLAEWQALWWRWSLSLPEATHPSDDATGEHCTDGQSGPVWFLADSFHSHPVVRKCTIPRDKFIFFPILTGFCSPLEGEPPLESALRQCARAMGDDGLLVSAEIDGIAVPGLEDPLQTRFRATTDVFAFSLPEGHIESWVEPLPPAGTVSTAVSDGVYLMIAPLPDGKHVLHFNHDVRDPEHGTHPNDITYELTIQ